MESMLRRFAVIAIQFFGCISAAGCVAGKAEAENDLTRNHLEICAYGLQSTTPGDYQRLLKERLGVTYNVVAGCVYVISSRHGPVQSRDDRRDRAAIWGRNSRQTSRRSCGA